MEARPRRTKSNPVPLRELLDDIEEGFIALPDFQRDFDWTEKDVSELLVTVLSGWPAGSLLFVAGRPEYLPPRSFDSGPSLQAELSHMVLDGQQRLTALYHAIRNHGAKVYWLDISNLTDVNVDDLEERVLNLDREEWEQKYGAAPSQYSSGMLPLHVLSTAADFFDWRDEVLDSLPESDVSGVRDSLNHLYRSFLSNVSTYEFPVVEISSKVEPEGVARIFERVNKTGMTLGPFDLMVARTFKSDWNLRNLWSDAASEHALLDRFLKDDGLPVLRAIALRSRQNVRRGAVLGLPASEVHENWEGGVEATDRALRYLVSKCGVLDSDWLPYQACLVLLTGLAFDYQLDEHDALLQRWFWSVTLGATYDVASNTRIVADYAALVSAIRGGADFAPAAISGNNILRATRRKRAIWRAFHCALAKNDAHDLLGDSLGFAATHNDPEASPPQPAWATLADRQSGFHLHALTRIACTRATHRQLRRNGLADLEVVPAAASSQFLKTADVGSAFETMLVRLDGVQAFTSDMGLAAFELDSDLNPEDFLAK